MKILVIDDHILFREGLIGLISRQSDMSVVGAGGTVREALELVHRTRPDLLLMDISLPDGTGLDAARAVLAEQPAVKIIFLTVHDDDSRLFAAVRMGAKGYLVKNIAASKLLATMRGVCRGEAGITRAMTARLMEEFVRVQATSAPADMPFTGLTAREMQVLRELVGDASNQEIAERLFISENTVRNHVHKVLTKLGVSSRREAVLLARQRGMGIRPELLAPPGELRPKK